MTDVSTKVFPDQPFLKVFDLNSKNEIPAGMPCDVWHVAGNSSYHKTQTSEMFIDYCKSKLERKVLPIFVGNTGYVHWKEAKPSGSYCWDVDELGRFVAVLDDIWMFQRYTNGDVIVWQVINDEYRNWNCINLEKITDLENKINNR